MTADDFHVQINHTSTFKFTENTSVLEAALAYAAMGWAVFPVKTLIDEKEDHKKPLVTWGEEATTDPATIKRWYKNWPSAGVAIACGAISGITVLDVDKRPDYTGFDGIRRLEKKYGELPTNGIQATSAGGGTHFYMRHPGNGLKVPLATAVEGNRGVDIRSDGGYIVAPPTQLSDGTKYRWVEGHEPGGTTPERSLATPPEWNCFKPKDMRPVDPNRVDSKQEIAIIPEGQRHTELLKIAGALRSMGMGVDAINAALTEVNSVRCRPPQDQAVIDQLAQSMFNYPDHRTNDPLLPDGTRVDRMLMSFEHTQSGFAEMVAYIKRNVWRYIESRNQWMVWAGHQWKPMVSSMMNHYIARASEIYRESARILYANDPERLEQALKWVGKIRNNVAVYNTIRNHIQGHELLRTTPSMWNADSRLLGVENGVIDLATGALRPGDPEDLISHCAGTHYDSDAECPRIDKFLSDIFAGDQEMINHFWQLLGYSLSGDTGEQSFYTFVGEGGNGKSVLMKVIAGLAGTYAAIVPFKTFDKNATNRQGANSATTDLCIIEGKRVVQAVEAADGAVFDESRIKSLTGEDPISVRQLYGTPYTFKPNCKVFMVFNSSPKMIGGGVAMERRLHRYLMQSRFDGLGQDKNLSVKLQEEFPGALNKAIRGYQEYLKQEKLIPPQSVITAAKQFQRASDPLYNFMEDCFIINKNDRQLILPLDTVCRVYSQWFNKQPMKPTEMISTRTLRSRFMDRFVSDHVSHQDILYGISLSEQGQKFMATQVVTTRISENSGVIINRVSSKPKEDQVLLS